MAAIGRELYSGRDNRVRRRRSKVPCIEEHCTYLRKRSSYMLQEIVAKYDQAPLWMRAAIWGLIVLVVGYSLDDIFHGFSLSWRSEQLAQNSIEGAIIMLAVATVLKNRDRRIRRRFQEIGYLNHQIRNALEVIQMAQRYAKEAEEREKLVSSSSLKIQLCLQKVSREEDLIDIANVQTTSAKRGHRRTN
jgi:hypothetical protein